MPFNAPTIRATGDLMTAAIWNSDVVNTINYLYLSSPRDAEYNAGNSGASITLNFATNGLIQRVTRTTSCTYSLVAPTLPQFVTLKFIRDSASPGSNFTVVFAPAVKWDHGAAPVWSQTANAIDILTLYWDGSVFYGTAQTAMA